MRKFCKIFLAFLMAASLPCLTACDVIGGFIGGITGDTNIGSPDGDNNNQGNISGDEGSGSNGEGEGGGNQGGDDNNTTPSVVKSSVQLVLNGGTASETLTEYTEGTAVTLPVPVKEHYSFVGWFANEAFSDDPVTEIPATAKGDKTFYAKWAAEEYTITYYINGVETTDLTLRGYGFGDEYALPVPRKANHTFNGWYASSDLRGDKLSKIEVGEFGNKTYYGEFISDSELQLTAFGGYEEGAYVEFAAVSGVKDSAYKVEYKSGSGSYKAIDGELIRVSDGKVRADIVGLAEGNYKIRVTAGTKKVEKDVAVTAYDRSGYAHFGTGTTGVGAYNNDGTPKSNAEIIYVSESNKNSVTASFVSGSGDANKGLVAILTNLSKAKKPVIIRVIGQISAATWKTFTYTKPIINGEESDLITKYVIEQTAAKTGKTLKTQTYTQEELISGGFNTYDTSKYSVLNNLSGSMKYDSSKDEFDSCWNDCSISGAENVTIEGIGTNAVIFQWGMTWKRSSSIEVRNLTFTDYTEDACSFEGSTGTTNVDEFTSQRIWLHHNTFNIGVNYWDVCKEQDKHDGDGSTDFKGVSYVTIAYNHYVKTHKTGLIGGSDSHKSANITFHHNFYDQCRSRLPLARQANMHMYNNYYYMSSDTNMSIRAGGYAFIENCYFQNASNPVVTQDGSGLKGVAKVFNCTFSGKNIDTSKYNVKVFTKSSDRATAVANENTFNQNFDTDPNAFYYSNGKTDVTEMLETSQVPTIIPSVAGVHTNK